MITTKIKTLIAVPCEMAGLKAGAHSPTRLGRLASAKWIRAEIAGASAGDIRPIPESPFAQHFGDRNMLDVTRIGGTPLPRI
jgi:hypothetical protein